MSNNEIRAEQMAYRVELVGRLDQDWSDWFDGLVATFERIEQDRPLTRLTTTSLDQAALRGLLCRIWDLNLVLISLVPVPATQTLSSEEKEVE
ncbi:MAG TPA: hypothetical protein VLY63_10305 [Anaerolineae bacterium]|nr:hypothetical protein [Anaerolineae bacterium]